MVGAGGVFELILNELEAGEADAIKGNVIGGTRVAVGHGVGADVVEGLEPGLEDGFYGDVFLGVDATYATAAIVEVEVRGEFFVGTLGLDGPGGFSEVRGEGEFVFVGGFGSCGEMVFDVGA